MLSGCRVCCAGTLYLFFGCRVYGLESRVYVVSARFRVYGFKVKVLRVGFKVRGVGSRVWEWSARRRIRFGQRVIFIDPPTPP